MVSQGGPVQGDSYFLTGSLEKPNRKMAVEAYSSPYSLKLVFSGEGIKMCRVRIVENMGWEVSIWAGQKFTPWGSGWLALLQVPGFVEKRKTENILNICFPVAVHCRTGTEISVSPCSSLLPNHERWKTEYCHKTFKDKWHSIGTPVNSWLLANEV